MILSETAPNNVNWELMWAPYDETTYQDVLDRIEPHDIVLDIGAGDLRLARRMAMTCRWVYALEIQSAILDQVCSDESDQLPKNLTIQPGDARCIPFPEGVTTGVLLMRHCNHFRLYADKLKAVGAKILITNARWRSGVEVIHLQSERKPYWQIEMGWYACWCGAVGYKPGSVEHLTPELESVIHEAVNCPRCEN
jgi:hypothetical protein